MSKEIVYEKQTVVFAFFYILTVLFVLFLGLLALQTFVGDEPSISIPEGNTSDTGQEKELTEEGLE